MIGQTVSHYRIIEKLGSGGMGVVYKAEDTKLGRTVALKFLPPSFSSDEEAKTRFVHEAKSASSLQHNNICTIHEIDETDDDKIFICMDFYEGETLKDRISKGPIAIDEAVDIILQICEGLEKAHNNNIIHRDIKPANIFITKEGVVKLLDFGLAKAANQSKITKMGSTLGTVAYMSPEQTRGESVDQRTDIWSLGVVLFEMLTGELPFKGDYEQAIIYSILNENPQSIDALHINAPIGLKKILEKTLRKNPSDRYLTVNEILSEINSQFSRQQAVNRKLVPSISKSSKQKKLAYIFSPIFIITIFIIIYLLTGKETLSKPVSIALLPLKDISVENKEDWFSEGMTDALITELARIRGLRITSRSSVMKYKDSNESTKIIAADLGVHYLIEGSIVRTLGQVKISARLIDATSDEYIWGQDYEGDFTDVLALQGKVAQEITHKIKVTLTPQEERLFTEKLKVNPDAYDAYLKGKFYLWKLTKEGFETALKYFTMAVELDSTYAPAYAGITLAWRTQAVMGFLPFSEAMEKSEAVTTKALQLDSSLADIHFMNAINFAWFQWKWNLAYSEFKKTIEVNPNMAEARAYYSQLLFILNRPDEAIQEIDLALKLDPFNNLFQSIYAMDLMYVKRYDDVIKLLNKILKAAPNEYMALATLRSAYHQTKMYEQALNIWIRSFEVRNDYEAIEVLKKGNVEGGYSLALRRVAELMIKRIKEGSYVTPWQVATLYTRAGMKKEALDWFEKALDANDPNMPYLKVDPIFDPLRDEPRFKKILEKMNLIKE
jgi:serine/threonine protein kinase